MKHLLKYLITSSIFGGYVDLPKLINIFEGEKKKFYKAYSEICDIQFKLGNECHELIIENNNETIELFFEKCQNICEQLGKSHIQQDLQIIKEDYQRDIQTIRNHDIEIKSMHTALNCLTNNNEYSYLQALQYISKNRHNDSLECLSYFFQNEFYYFRKIKIIMKNLIDINNISIAKHLNKKFTSDVLTKICEYLPKDEKLLKIFEEHKICFEEHKICYIIRNIELPIKLPPIKEIITTNLNYKSDHVKQYVIQRLQQLETELILDSPNQYINVFNLNKCKILFGFNIAVFAEKIGKLSIFRGKYQTLNLQNISDVLIDAQSGNELFVPYNDYCKIRDCDKVRIIAHPISELKIINCNYIYIKNEEEKYIFDVSFSEFAKTKLYVHQNSTVSIAKIVKFDSQSHQYIENMKNFFNQIEYIENIENTKKFLD